MEGNSSEKILHKIHFCTNLIQKLVNSEHQRARLNTTETGIGHSQLSVLSILLKNDGLTQKEITSQLRIRSASLGELLSKLEQNGYVEKHSNENDKRTYNVYLTEKGRTAANNFANARQIAVDSWCSGLSDTDKDHLSDLLEKLIISMEEKLSEDTDSFNER